MEGLYPGYETGQTSGKPSVFALKTVINCFLNERHLPHQGKDQDHILVFIFILEIDWYEGLLKVFTLDMRRDRPRASPRSSL